jgi:hypothetical protein
VNLGGGVKRLYARYNPDVSYGNNPLGWIKANGVLSNGLTSAHCVVEQFKFPSTYGGYSFDEDNCENMVKTIVRGYEN